MCEGEKKRQRLRRNITRKLHLEGKKTKIADILKKLSWVSDDKRTKTFAK